MCSSSCDCNFNFFTSCTVTFLFFINCSTYTNQPCMMPLNPKHPSIHPYCSSQTENAKCHKSYTLYQLVLFCYLRTLLLQYSDATVSFSELLKTFDISIVTWIIFCVLKMLLVICQPSFIHLCTFQLRSSAVFGVVLCVTPLPVSGDCC